MIINRLGAKFSYLGTTYVIGEPVIATAESEEYAGLSGIIYEIREGTDRETENDQPDLYCRFNPPSLPSRAANLIERFAALYGIPKTMDEITLDCVILSPGMVRPLNCSVNRIPCGKAYLITEEWANDSDCGSSISDVFTERDEAMIYMDRMLGEEMACGCIETWRTIPAFQEESTETGYECYLNDEYCSHHYRIALQELDLFGSSQFIRSTAEKYTYMSYLEDLKEQIEPWEDRWKLTDEQYECLATGLEFPQRLEASLNTNDLYWEAYWDSVSSVAFEMIREYLKEGNK